MPFFICEETGDMRKMSTGEGRYLFQITACRVPDVLCLGDALECAHGREHMGVLFAQMTGVVQHIGCLFTVKGLRAIDVAKVIDTGDVVVFKEDMPVVLVVGGCLEGLADTL